MAQVITEDGNTDFFSIEAGVLQGDTLAPYLFIIVIDYIMRTATKDSEELGFKIRERRSSRHPAAHLIDTDFADDIALISNTIQDAQRLLTLIVNAAKNVGLHINESKTEYIAYNISEGHHQLIANGKPIKLVPDFKYLGSWIDKPVKDLKIRKAQAWTAARKLDNIWKSNLDRRIKISFFRATVENILLYASETWTTTAGMNDEINGAYTRLLRHALNIHWRQHITNTELYGDLKKASDLVRSRRLKFAGHCFRSTEVAADLVLWKPTYGHRTQGRPQLDYITLLNRDTGLDPEDLSTAMQNRNSWREYSMDSGTPD